MGGASEDPVDVAALQHLAGIEHHHLVAELGDQAEIVRDHDHGGVQLRLELPQQQDDLGLHGHVERGRRLVGDQQGRVGEQRHGDAGPLPHPAAELMRILQDAARRTS